MIVKRLYHKHKTEWGNVRLFRWVIPVTPRMFGCHAIVLHRIGSTSGDYYLDIMYNGRMYGKFYKEWRTHGNQPSRC